MAATEIILKEKVEGLGAEADVVKVKRGYAVNYLIPRGLAYAATKGNLRHLEGLQRKRTERESQERAASEAIASKIRKLKITLELATGKAGKAFGSVTNMDVSKALEEKGVVIDRHSIELEKAIKNTGDFNIPIRLHPEVVAELHLRVRAARAPEQEEDEESEGKTAPPAAEDNASSVE